MAAPYVGKNVFIYIDLNDVGGAGANWAKIGKQRGGSKNRGSNIADTQHKDDDGWETGTVVSINWSISVDGILDPVDAAWAFIDGKWSDQEKLYVKIGRSGISGTSQEGLALVSTLNDDFADKDVVKFTCELKGDGALSTATV